MPEALACPEPDRLPLVMPRPGGPIECPDSNGPGREQYQLAGPSRAHNRRGDPSNRAVDPVQAASLRLLMLTLLPSHNVRKISNTASSLLLKTSTSAFTMRDVMRAPRVIKTPGTGHYRTFMKQIVKKQRDGCTYPLPTNGILVAMTVMNWTFASRGRLAMYSTASATWRISIRGSTARVPSA